MKKTETVEKTKEALDQTYYGMRKKVYQTRGYTHGKIRINESVEGETIEMKVDRILSMNEPIKDGAPTIYTDRKDGVMAGYNIRTDRFEIAITAMDTVHSTNAAKREGKADLKVLPKESTENDTTSKDDGSQIRGTNE